MINKVKKYTSLGLVFLVGFLFSSLQTVGQEQREGKKLIRILNANTSRYNEAMFPGAERLIGDVKVLHAGITMTCDSAHLFSKENRVLAFGNVMAEQGDTLFLWGDRLDYNGNTEFAKVRGNVKLKDPQITLTTDRLDYDMVANVGYYTTGGRIVDSTNVLVSQIGRYYADQDRFFFKDNVVVTSENFTLESDTLKYYSISEIAEIVGPTTITGTEGDMYSEGGWFDTKNDICHLTRNSRFKNKEGEQELLGDTIHYEKATGLGEAFQNVILNDLKNNVSIYGNQGNYNELSQYAMVTDSAVLVQRGEQDTLYMHADTLRSRPDTLGSEDKVFFGYQNVRFFKPDLQGKCDSLIYMMKDSTIEMNIDPILWSPGNQMRAKQIVVFDKKEDPDLVKLYENSFVIMEAGPMQFNQIKGRNMTGFIRNNEVYQIDVDGNGQSIYYAKDQDDVMGVNNGEASNITIRLKDRRINTITFKDSPNMSLNPQSWLTPSDKELKDFEWREDIRPKDKDDIFPRIPMAQQQTVEAKVTGSVVKMVKEALTDPTAFENRLREMQKLPEDTLQAIHESVDPAQIYQIMNSPMVRQLLKSPQIQSITSSLNVNEFVKVEAIKLLQSPEKLEMLLQSEQAKELLESDKVKQLMSPDSLKQMIDTLDTKEILESEELEKVKQQLPTNLPTPDQLKKSLE